MNNYVKIFSLDKNLYAAGYPVVIEAGVLFRNNDNGKLHFQLKFHNISEKNVVSLKTIIILMDSMGREIYRAPKQYDDLRAAPNSTFGEKIPVFLKLDTVRRFAVYIEEVCFSDNTLWYSKGDENVVNIPAPSPLSVKFPSSEAQAEFCRILCMQARFVPFEFEDLWICACGTINKKARKTCSSCGADCEKMLAADNDTLKNHYLSYKKEIETRRIYDEASMLVEKYNSSDIRKGIALFKSISDRVDCREKIEAARNGLNEQLYREASALIEKNDSDSINRGIAVFRSIPDWKDSQDKITQAEDKLTDMVYVNACALIEKNDPDSINQGIAVFRSIPDWKDSQDKIAQAEDKLTDMVYVNACALVRKNKPDDIRKGISLFESIIDRKDSYARIEQATEKLNRKNKEIKTNKKEENEEIKTIPEQKSTLKEKISNLFAPKNRKKTIIATSSIALVLILILTSVFIGSVFIGNNIGNNIKEDKYLQAQKLIVYNKPEEAKAIFSELNGYKYSEQFLLQLKYGSSASSDFRSAIRNGKLTLFVVPYGFTNIGTSMFGSCTTLKSIIIPDSITSIGLNAFYGCHNLVSITMSNSVTVIEANAFTGCSSLKVVNYRGTANQWKNISISDGNDYLKTAKINYIK